MPKLLKRSLGKELRRAYFIATVLLALLIALTAVSDGLSKRLYELEAGRYVDMLFECADSLKRLENAAEENDEKAGLEALFAFRRSASSLELSTQLTKALIRYAESLYEREAQLDSELIENELLRAAYTGDISGLERLLLPSEPIESAADDGTAPLIPERHLTNEAEREAEILLYDVSGLPKLTAVDKGYEMTSDNLHIGFSGKDGSFEELFFLRSGSNGREADENEVLSRAAVLADRLGFRGERVTLIEKSCGFYLIDVYDRLRLLFDQCGRLCAAIRLGETS